MIEPAIRAILLADATTNALTGDRIRPNNLAADEAVSGNPSVAYQVIGGESQDCLSAEAQYVTENLQVDCFAGTYANAKALADAVKNALHFYDGTAGSINVANIEWQGTTNETPPADLGEEVPIYHLSLSFSCFFQSP